MSDLIDRQAAIDAIFSEPLYEPGMKKRNADVVVLAIYEKIKSLPSAQRTGRWIWDDEGYHCSECFYHAYGNTSEVMCGDFKFCPNCGARMEEEDG